MLSRIADSLYWLHRYMERADGMLRLMHTSYILSFDKVQASSMSWEPSLRIFTVLPKEEIDRIKKDNAAALHYLFLETKNQNSLKVIITKARENARGVQDQITKEVWEQVNLLYHQINKPGLKEKLAGPEAIRTIDSFIKSSDQFCGITDSTMPRGQGWNYMNLGKYTERCLMTTEFTHFYFKKLDFDLKDEQDIIFWRSLLLSLSGYELHLKNYSNLKHNYNVLQQLAFDKNFPRAIYYSLDRANRYLTEIAGSNPVEGSIKLLRTYGRLYSSVKFADIELVEREGLEKYLIYVRNELKEFSQDLGRIYFSYS